MAQLRYALAVLLTLLALPVHAVEDRPLTFARTQFVIVPAAAPAADAAAQEAAQLPWQEKSQMSLAPTAQPRAKGILFNAQLRDATTVYTQGWFNLNGLSPEEALMLVLQPPAIASIRPVNDFAAYDILLVGPDGKIIQILPNLILADLEEPYQTPKAVDAIIYLRCGLCAELEIAPGDKVVNKFFRTPPKVLQAPGTSYPEPKLKVRAGEQRENQNKELLRRLDVQSRPSDTPTNILP